jgi:hypothetical protein
VHRWIWNYWRKPQPRVYCICLRMKIYIGRFSPLKPIDQGRVIMVWWLSVMFVCTGSLPFRVRYSKNCYHKQKRTNSHYGNLPNVLD